MGQDPDEIREEIARTRAEMGETVDAIGYKADVPARAREKLSDVTPSRGQVERTARRAVRLARENPLGLAAGAIALGFLAGLAAPSTRVEDQRLGKVADQVKDRVRETGQEAVERGREVVKQAAQSAVDTAREQGQQHGQAVTEHARERAQDIRP